jgi:hypothetical protein
VLFLHALAHERGNVLLTEQLRVVAALTANDTPTIDEQMRRQMRAVDTRILGLDVEYTTPVLHVVVEANLWGR